MFDPFTFPYLVVVELRIEMTNMNPGKKGPRKKGA